MARAALRKKLSAREAGYICQGTRDLGIELLSLAAAPASASLCIIHPTSSLCEPLPSLPRQFFFQNQRDTVYKPTQVHQQSTAKMTDLWSVPPPQLKPWLPAHDGGIGKLHTSVLQTSANTPCFTAPFMPYVQLILGAADSLAILPAMTKETQRANSTS